MKIDGVEIETGEMHVEIHANDYYIEYIDGMLGGRSLSSVLTDFLDLELDESPVAMVAQNGIVILMTQTFLANLAFGVDSLPFPTGGAK